MIAKWEQRRNGYFAYARYSWRDEGIPKTINKYLGSDIATAVENFNEFAKEIHMEPSQVNAMAEALVKQGNELGIRQDRYVYDNKGFTEEFHNRFTELAELAKEATTKKSREHLSNQIIELGAVVLSYVNTQKLL